MYHNAGICSWFYTKTVHLLGVTKVDKGSPAVTKTKVQNTRQAELAKVSRKGYNTYKCKRKTSQCLGK